MTCPVCGLGEKGKKKRRKRRAREAPTWESVSAAVALITAGQARSDDTVADLIGGQSAERVLRAQVIVMRAMLDVLAPETGTRALRAIGLLALEEVSRGQG